jgi:hypothetical protein
MFVKDVNTICFYKFLSPITFIILFTLVVARIIIFILVIVRIITNINIIRLKTYYNKCL